MANTLLESKKLCKSYSIKGGITQKILDDIDLQIEQKEFIALMGPSGSGKSTLLHCLSGMENLSSGEILFEGENLCAFTENEKSNIRLNKMGFVFQQPHFLENLTIFDNIILSGYLAKKEPKPTISERASNLMTKFNISAIANKNITQVSGGQLQRASICRSLINTPKIIFADEPTGALNSSATNDVMNVFSKVNASGTTLIVATHDIGVAAHANRIIYLTDGKVSDEKHFNKNESISITQKEKNLSEWLLSHGF